MLKSLPRWDGVPHAGGPRSCPVTITIETAPVDEHGRLMHADDPIAQTCLAVRRLESALAHRDLPASAITAILLLTAEPSAAGDLVDVVAEELDRLRSSASVGIGPDDGIDVEPGMLVRLKADVDVSIITEKERSTMYSTNAEVDALSELRSVLVPGDAGYADACRAWNLAVSQRPAAVAVPESIEDVARVVRAAAATGLRIVPQSTGHAASALADVDFSGVLLLRMHKLTGVTVDPATRTARVLGGTVWCDVVEAAAPHELTALHGSAGDVAVAGYVLGGGLSFFAREYGFTTNTVRAIEVVTASGDLIRATPARHTELFWALRGGGGNFGVVVAIELELLSISDVVAGMLLWDMDQAPDVLRAWVSWTESVPETVTTNIRLMRFPAVPELPPFLSGRSLVVIDGAVHESDERATELLAPLRALEPELDTFGRIPAAGLLAVHMDPPGPTAGVSDHCMVIGLPEAAVAALLDAAGPGVETSLLFAELRHVGGAVARPHDAALARLDGEYALFALSEAPTPELQRVGEVQTRSVVDALRPWSTGRCYPNFAERPTGVEDSSPFDVPTRQRLTRVRDVYDPDRLWVAAHPIG